MNAENQQPVRMRVMIVDDEVKLREAWQSLVRAQPDMDVAASLASADRLALAVLEVKPDVVILDLRMPGKDPLEALREAVTARPETRAVVFSAMSDQQIPRLAMEAGAWAYVDKLESPDVILATLRRVCRMDARPSKRTTQ